MVIATAISMKILNSIDVPNPGDVSSKDTATNRLIAMDSTNNHRALMLGLVDMSDPRAQKPTMSNKKVVGS